MHIHNSITQKIAQVCTSRPFSTSSEEFQKSIQVSLLGAHTHLGKYASLLLKQNPLLSTLNIQGDQTLEVVAHELNHIDTRCRVHHFEGDINISKAIRSADIVVMLGVQNLKEDTSLADRIMAEARRVYEMAKVCTAYAPRSVILVNVPPISVFTPLVAGVFKETNWYNPGRIIGSAALAQVKANSLLGRYQDLDPNNCQVPIIGGPDQDLAVPLFSRAKPVELNNKSAKTLLAKFRGIREDEFPKKMSKENAVENCPLSEAFALNHLISTIGMGMCGDKNAYCNAFVRSNVITTCKHIVSTLRLSRGGAVHNCGIPQLTQLELKMFERAALQIKDREQMAKDLLEYLEKGAIEPPPFKQADMERKKKLQQKVVRC